MKINLLEKKWLDIVFEGRNKSYGAYELRKEDDKTNIKAFIIGAVVFAFAVATPMIADFIGSASNNDDEALNQKITTVKLPPKEVKPKENLPPPPPPPPKVDQVKFVKPVVAKTNEVTEEIVQVEKVKDKKLGDQDLKGDPNAVQTVEPVGNGPAKQEVVEEDNTIYNSAAVQVQASFQGGPEGWKKYLERSYQAPDEPGLNGRVLVSFVVEKDGTLTDIKVLKDIGFGTGAEAVRVLKKGPKWTPAVQNGRNVRSTFTQSFSIVTAEE